MLGLMQLGGALRNWMPAKTQKTARSARIGQQPDPHRRQGYRVRLRPFRALWLVSIFVVVDVLHPVSTKFPGMVADIPGQSNSHYRQAADRDDGQ